MKPDIYLPKGAVESRTVDKGDVYGPGVLLMMA